MESGRTAFVVSHPAHLLTVLGLVQRHRPQILFLTYASTGAGSGQTELLRQLLAQVDLRANVRCLPLDERESYARALAGDFAFHQQFIPQIEQWLCDVRPHQVFGDAYELTNYHHDLGRLLLDAAVTRARAAGLAIDNFEFPLSSQADRPGAKLEYGRFLLGPFRTYRLTPAELAVKQRLAAWAGTQDRFVAEMARHFTDPSVEVYRPVSADRDYTRPPCGLVRWYDACGAEEVAAGRHARPILFHEHFVPIAEVVRRRQDAAA